MVLDEIEANIPYQQIYIDKSQNKVDEQITDEQKAEIADKARILIAMAKDMGGDSFNRIIDRLWNSEPFNKVPELKKQCWRNILMIDLDRISKLTGFVDKLIQLKGIEDASDERKNCGIDSRCNKLQPRRLFWRRN